MAAGATKPTATSESTAAAMPQSSPPNVNNGNGYGNNADDNVVLLNTFVIWKKRYRVFYHSSMLVWEKNDSKSDRVSIPIADVITVSPALSPLPSTQNHNNHVDGNVQGQQQQLKHFTVVYAKRCGNSANVNKWRHHTISLHNNDFRIVDLWIRTLQTAIQEQTSRPKKLLLFINPFGGKKKGLQIYDNLVKPIFSLAGVDASVVVSQRSNQIREFIMTQSLETFDGIVCIGGDGTFSEVFNGLVFRTIKQFDLDTTRLQSVHLPTANMPVGVIPAGSTDTVAYCLNGTTDIRSIVLHIVLGQVNGLDLASVSNANGLVKFYASVMSYGFLGDVAIDSEKFRWMGPKRYDYSGFKKLLTNRGYDGELTMHMAPNDTPTKGPRCLENCQKCLCGNEIISKPSVIGIANGNDGAGGDCSVIASATGNCADRPVIKTINGKFFMVNGANISCACVRSPNGFSKFCHLGDGYVDLVLVRHTSFINNIKFLMAMSSQNSNITELPHVEIYRTSSFSFRPNGMQPNMASSFNLHGSTVPISVESNSNQTSIWNCDGEVIHDTEITVRCHRNLINVYRRGPYGGEQAGSSTIVNCCGLY